MYPTEISPLDDDELDEFDSSKFDLSVAAEEIPEGERCTSCGGRCIGVSIRVAGIDRICGRCFRDRKYAIIRDENDGIPRYHRGKSKS